MNITDLYLKNISSFAQSEIPAKVKLRFKLALLDYIGVTFAGAKAQYDKLSLMLADADKGNAAVIGIDRELSFENAVFYNGLNAHALDFDDGTNTGIIHLGSPLFSVLLPLAKKYNLTAECFMKAVIIGYEAAFTMASSIQPRHKELGYHATGTCGTLSVALAVAEALGFSEKQRKDAFSAAAVSATGTLKVLEDSSDLKPYNVAKAALFGYMAALMGKAGFNGPDDALSGDRGFLKLMYGDDSIDFNPTMLNGTYAIEKAYIKPYAACRYCHPPIEAALNIRKSHGVKAEDIQSIMIRTYSLAINKHDHVEIGGSGSAKMSIPYSVAVALDKGRAGTPEYEESIILDQNLINLTRKVRVAADQAMSASFPIKQGAAVEVTTIDGTVFSEQVDFPKGEPENPMTIEEVYDKFMSLTIFSGRTAKEAEDIFNAVMNLDEQFDLFLEMISGTRNSI